MRTLSTSPTRVQLRRAIAVLLPAHSDLLDHDTRGLDPMAKPALWVRDALTRRAVACTMGTVRCFVLFAALGLGACAPARPAAEPMGDTTRHDSEGTGQRGLDPTKVEAPKLEALFEQRVDEASARPAIDQAIEELLTSLMSDHTLAAQGAALFEALGNDPQLAARGKAIQESWGEGPEMEALVMRLIAEHPGASAEQIGELAGQHIERQTESQTFDQAFDFAVDRLFERPQLTAAFDSFGEAVANNRLFERGITSALNGIDYRPVVERLTAFNGGSEPDSDRATQILIDHAFTTDRVEALLLDWLRLPETRSELGRLAGDVLQAPSFRKRLVAVSTQLLSDAEIQRRLRNCFVLLLDAQPDPAKMKARFRDALDTPRMDTLWASFMAELMQDPALQAMGSRFLERVTKSQGFSASIQRFMTDW